ncbi:MAG: hypothetical protein OEX16_03965 [Hadesarchaea archaeon]|nr:hypothetical protein [Hadesarchaea archaeon]MDH5685743.1 hypothetical protein [Hadesarchaea archaeon]
MDSAKQKLPNNLPKEKFGNEYSEYIIGIYLLTMAVLLAVLWIAWGASGGLLMR